MESGRQVCRGCLIRGAECREKAVPWFPPDVCGAMSGATACEHGPGSSHMSSPTSSVRGSHAGAVDFGIDGAADVETYDVSVIAEARAEEAGDANDESDVVRSLTKSFYIVF